MKEKLLTRTENNLCKHRNDSIITSFIYFNFTSNLSLAYKTIHLLRVGHTPYKL